MKKEFIRLFLFALLSVTVMQATAQKTAITFSFLNMAFYANTSPVTQGYMGIGIERNIGEFISLKLEINQGMQLLYKLTDGKILTVAGNENDKSWEDGTGSYNVFYYHWTVPSFDINYQSKFFFRGNDKTGPYMAMGIGVRSVKYTLHLGSLEYSGEDEIPSDILNKDGYSEKLTVIPLILRIGARGDMEGFFPDFSFGLGYNMSHNKTIKDNTITQTWDLSVPKLSGVTLTGSISFGIGW